MYVTKIYKNVLVTNTYMYNNIQHDMRMNVILAHKLKWEEKFHLQRFRRKRMIIFDLKNFFGRFRKKLEIKNSFHTLKFVN